MTRVRAAAGGTVTDSQWGTGGGRCVLIAHHDPPGDLRSNSNATVPQWRTLYPHLTCICAVKGEKVKAGQLIGFSGATCGGVAEWLSRLSGEAKPSS